MRGEGRSEVCGPGHGSWRVQEEDFTGLVDTRRRRHPSHLRAYEYENLTQDEHYQVLRAVDVIEGSNLPQDVAGSKQHCAQGVQPDQLEAVVMTSHEVSCRLLVFEE